MRMTNNIFHSKILYLNGKKKPTPVAGKVSLRSRESECKKQYCYKRPRNLNMQIKSNHGSDSKQGTVKSRVSAFNKWPVEHQVFQILLENKCSSTDNVRLLDPTQWGPKILVCKSISIGTGPWIIFALWNIDTLTPDTYLGAKHANMVSKVLLYRSFAWEWQNLGY